MGVVANIPTEFKNGRYVGESGSRLKQQLSPFNPLKVHPLWNFRGHTGYAVVDFANDWTGFRDAMAFENHFEADRRGKRDWLEGRFRSSKIYGWVARAGDYTSAGPAGDHLRKNGDLKSVGDLAAEESGRADRLVANLASQIEVKSKHLRELECKYNETSLSLDTMMEQRDLLLQSYNEEIQRMQQLARHNSRRVLAENESLRSELDSKRRELEARGKQLEKLVAQNEIDTRKLAEEKRKVAIFFMRAMFCLFHVQNAAKKSLLQLAAMEQKKADEEVLRLLEDQKREKEAALNKILQLEKQLDQKQKLELEIQQLKGQLQIMKHMEEEEEEEGDATAREKISDMKEQLQEKMEEMEDLEALNQALFVKERMSNDELQEARKELIHVRSSISEPTLFPCTS
ncbi:XH domain [Musa troglodytarum]|uniref:XH domain n=1 Tax=Musa troglodytarum TaxID=320322 RepID=A0A9E7G8A6_9LILI|nr:XH domain [Musa troglodytarum]